jgi:predicted transposase YbfD/YdcC
MCEPPSDTARTAALWVFLAPDRDYPMSTHAPTPCGTLRRPHGPGSGWASPAAARVGAVWASPLEVEGLLKNPRTHGCIVTLDAIGCQKEIAARIGAKRADYLLVLKANHGHAFAAVREHFERTGFGRGSGGRPMFDAFDESHGRLVRRRVFVSPTVGALEPLRDWPGLRAVLAVEAIRGVTGTGKIEAEIRYFLTSCGDDPAVLVQAIRRHWSIENALHWLLDVTFREDDSRVRDRTAARNLALLGPFNTLLH